MSTSRKLLLILSVTLFGLYVALPSELPVKIPQLKLNKTIKKPGIYLKIKNFVFQKDWQLHYGLDLAGGSDLTFEADTSKVALDKKESALQSVKDIIEKRVNLYGVSDPLVQTSSFEGKDRIKVELPGIQNTKDAIELIGKTAQLTFADVISASDGARLIPTNLTGADLESASVSFDQTSGKPAVSIVFTSDGSKKFEEITGRDIGKPLAIVLDNQVVSAPIVQGQISGGHAQINGTFTLPQAQELSVQLNAGALPVPVKLVEERTVGASLGADSINKSIKAGVVGLGIVMLFMVLSYGRLGLVADVALVIFGIITLALYKIIPISLTLPGISGFLLSVGMAVDGNILIFERFKEERLNRPIPDALEVAFGRAWNSIRDANVATLIAAFVLANPLSWSFLNSSGPVRGFAITLALGIVISLFTGIVVTRNLLRFFIRAKHIQASLIKEAKV